jgi:membrane protease subunit (stomatin/prohibitin family)
MAKMGGIRSPKGLRKPKVNGPGAITPNMGMMPGMKNGGSVKKMKKK